MQAHVHISRPSIYSVGTARPLEAIISSASSNPVPTHTHVLNNVQRGFLKYAKLYYITLHYITLHYQALHYLTIRDMTAWNFPLHTDTNQDDVAQKSTFTDYPVCNVVFTQALSLFNLSYFILLLLLLINEVKQN